MILDVTHRVDGLENMAKVKAYDGGFTKFKAFSWIDDKNPAGTDYSSAGAGVWYLPAIEELYDLYESWNGGSGETELDGMRDHYDNLFEAAGGSKITLAQYYSSTECGTLGNTVRVVSLNDGSPGGSNVSGKNYPGERSREQGLKFRVKKVVWVNLTATLCQANLLKINHVN